MIGKRSSPTVRAGVTLAATFLAGALFAVVVMLALAPAFPPPGSLPLPLAQLDLSPAQEAEVLRIIEANRPAVEKALRDVRPRVREVQDRVEREIREVLTEDQRRRFDVLKKGSPPPPLPR